MTPERWRRIEELFHEAVEREGEAREEYLVASCGEDAALRREVESLLSAHVRAEGFIEEPAAESMAPPVPFPEVPWEGRRIGPYRIVEPIGEGGMSRVFLAVRADEEFEDRVAVKVLRGGPSSDLALERFERERQILAGLDHPGIARLRDGGTLPEGLPYVVMDYVEGVPIDAYCDREDLGVEERLELFTRVCDAVQAAHRSLVVHRDLKPANILVTQEGEPRLLDFGIAKPLDPEAAPEVTRTWLRVLTPRYASPEQVTGGPITTATDVYALGLLLFELLTGRPPYDVSDLPVTAWQRTVVEVEAPRPSQVAESVARRRRLRGDLDTIVLTALRKDPARRYGTVEALRDDIHRHRRNQPVRARPDTFLYRAGKLVRRNRIAAALAGALFALSLGFGTFATLQAERLERERAKAEQALDFLVDLFRESDPFEGSGARPASEVSAREILENGARRVEEELGDRPEVRDTLLQAIGEVHFNLGLAEEAEALLARVVEHRTERLGRGHPETLESLTSLAGVLEDRGEYAEAEERYREAVEGLRERLGPLHPRTLEALSGLGQALRWQDRPAEAEEILREALDGSVQVHGSDHPRVADLLSSLADVRHARGDYAEAEELLGRAIDIRSRVDGAKHPRTARLVNRLAVIQGEAGKIHEAAANYREANAVFRETLGPDHPQLLAGMVGLGMTLKDLGRYAEAEKMLRHVLERRRERLGPDHWRVGLVVNNLATVAADRGDWEESARLYRETLGINLRIFGEGTRYPALSRSNLGFALRELGQLDEAAELQRRALETLRSLYGDDHPLCTRPVLELGKIALARGEIDEAQRLAHQALERRRELLPPGHRWIREAGEVMGAVHVARGRHEEAEPLLLAAAQPPSGELHGSKRRRVLRALVELYRSWDKPGEAARYAEELEAARSSSESADPP